MVQTTYTNLRKNLKEYMDRAVDDSEIIVINRNKTAAVAMIAIEELESLLELAHLFKSPKNRKRLFDAYHRAQEGSVAPQSLEELRREVGLVEEKASA